MRRLFLLLTLAWGLLAQDTTVVLVRHAEKASSAPDAELSDVGRQRAERLAELLAPRKPLRLVATEYARTQQTLAPLAHRLGLKVQVERRRPEAALAQELLQACVGGTVVVCTHSNLVGSWVKALGLPWSRGDAEGYDGLWVVTVGADGRRALQERSQDR